MGLVLLVILIILLLGGLPNWQIHDLGYGPSGLFTFLLIIVILMILMGHIPRGW